MPRRKTMAVVLAAALFGGCASISKPASSGDAAADFSAHLGYFGIVVDRMDGGASANVVRADASNGPAYLLESDDHTVAALWMTDRDHVTVRQAPDATASLLGDVHASWQDGLVRVALQPPDGALFHTSRFVRANGENSPRALVRDMSVQDIPGVYRAELRDAQGAPVGWLRVTILPSQGLPRDYAAFVPERLNGPLLAAAVALIDAEINMIIDRNAFPSDRSPGGLLGTKGLRTFRVAFGVG